ncbi:predicted protein [Plenodomus lingam JN3]|uniref:Predicted protein n=1 Tax=Leptosphaeria maculans (strain JN3 / isolate v23.1.3 / race Av1-4-5-6-7-8) TaxID=985895 RepID=E5ADM3_LEPMJ|nr:predicted protein [Plenodomus lingam JN3]CBY01312.1 predicted protein [Plenodomus lingam JN3]
MWEERGMGEAPKGGIIYDQTTTTTTTTAAAAAAGAKAPNLSLWRVYNHVLHTHGMVYMWHSTPWHHTQFLYARRHGGRTRSVQPIYAVPLDSRRWSSLPSRYLYLADQTVQPRGLAKKKPQQLAPALHHGIAVGVHVLPTGIASLSPSASLLFVTLHAIANACITSFRLGVTFTKTLGVTHSTYVLYSTGATARKRDGPSIPLENGGPEWAVIIGVGSPVRRQKALLRHPPK